MTANDVTTITSLFFLIGFIISMIRIEWHLNRISKILQNQFPQADAAAKETTFHPPETTLHDAAQQNEVSIIKTLLANGANPNTKDTNGQPPIHPAAIEGNIEIIKTLLNAGADPNSKDNYRQTTLHLAAMHGHLEIIKILLDAGANPNAKDNDDKTPLDRAKQFENPEAVQILQNATNQ